MLASVIINQARTTLADPSGDKWDDARLTLLMNNCIQDLATSTQLFDDIGFVELESGKSLYDLSDTVIRLNRVEFNQVPLIFATHDEMDRGTVFRSSESNRADYDFSVGGSLWQNDVSATPTRIVYDLRREFTVYPIPEFGEGGEAEFGVIDTFNYEDVELEVVGRFGTINLTNHLKLFYTRAPLKITDPDQELDKVILRTMEAMITHYIVGHCYRDNQDDKNLRLGTQELQLYEIDKQKFISQHGTGIVNKKLNTGYNGIG